MAFAIYKPKTTTPLKAISGGEMVSNQRVLSGTNPEIEVSGGIFFLDTLIVAAGVTITDWDGNSLGAGITSFALNNNHIRLDGGIKITGAVLMAKGYVVYNVIKS